MTRISLCKDSDGYVFAVALPDDSEDCENGPVLGPPEGLMKKVHNRMAELGIYNAFDLMGRSRELKKILRDLGVESSYARTVKSIYQLQYFGKQEDEK